MIIHFVALYFNTKIEWIQFSGIDTCVDCSKLKNEQCEHILK